MVTGILIIVGLAILNGIFAMSETAIISARAVRLQQGIDDGSQNARRALELSQDPNRFLATVQIGITLIGVLAGAFGSAALADDLSASLRDIPFLASSSDILAVALIVLFTTYLSLVIGELVPKRLALLNSERIAMLVARPMHQISRLAAPVVWFLGVSTSFVLWLLPVQTTDESSVTDADIEGLVQQGVKEGVFAQTEPEMVAGALGLDASFVNSIMIPRTEMIWLDIHDSEADITRTILENERTRFPVAANEIDNVIGFVETKDLLDRALQGKPFDLRSCLREPLFIPKNAPILKALEMFKQSHHDLALVIGEYGGIEGMITVNDILEEIVGDVDQEDPQAIQREDGSWLIDGLYRIEDFEELFDIDVPEEAYRYQTVNGFVLTHMERIPQAADHFYWAGLRIEVVDMDGKRIDKVLVTAVDEGT